jgi:hypothetical protein
MRFKFGDRSPLRYEEYRELCIGLLYLPHGDTAIVDHNAACSAARHRQAQWDEMYVRGLNFEASKIFAEFVGAASPVS